MTPEMLDKAFNKIRKAIRCLFCDFLKLKGLVDTYYPCIGYVIEIIRGSAQLEYIDCNGVLQNVILTGGIYRICARKGTVAIEGNGSFYEDIPSAPCPTPPCKDYLIYGVGAGDYEYFDCNRQIIAGNIAGDCIAVTALEGTIIGVGIDIQEGTECPTTTTTTTTAVPCFTYTVTNNGVIPFSYRYVTCAGDVTVFELIPVGNTTPQFCAQEGSIEFDLVVPNSITVIGPC